MNQNLSAELRGIASNVAAIMAAAKTLTPEAMELSLLSVELHLDRIAEALDS